MLKLQQKPTEQIKVNLNYTDADFKVILVFLCMIIC